MLGISFESIRRQMSGYRPSASVFLQDIDNQGRAGRQVRELKGWTVVNTTVSTISPGTASITLSNLHDRYYRNRYQRNIGQGEKADQDKTSTTAYLNDVLGRTVDYIKYLNPTRRAKFFGKGDFARQNAALNYIAYVRDLLAYNGPKQGADQLPGDAVDLGVLQRVFVDYKGRDGQIYAGFTGVLSNIIDNMTPGEQPTVTLVCKDFWRLFQFSEVILKEAPGYNLLDETITLDVQNELGLENYYGSSIFDGMDGISIIKNLVKIMQSSFCADVYSAQKLTNLAQQPPSPAAIAGLLTQNQDKFFYQDSFFNFSDVSELVPNYDGISPLRTVASAATNVPVIVNGVQYAVGDIVPGRTPGQGIKDGDLVAQLASQIYIDRAIGYGPQAEVYRKVVERILQPFQAQRSRGDVILRKVAEATMYEVFFDTNGNLIYQIPRRNNFPGEYNPNIGLSVSANVASNPTVSADTSGPENTDNPANLPLLTITPSGVQSLNQSATYDFTQAGAWDYSPPGEELPTKDHGFNYIITDLSLKGWSLLLSEEPIVTNVRTPTGFNFVNFSEVIASRYLTGITRLGFVRYLQRRFGIRSIETSKLFLPRFMSVEQQNVHNRSVDDTYALAVMANMNATASSGTVTLTARPDLSPGKNIFLLERARLYEVQTISQQVRQGDELSTVLSLSYGHDVGERIPNPWVSIVADIKGDLPTSDAGAVSPTGQELDQVSQAAGDQIITVGPTGSTATIGPTLVFPGGRESLNRLYGNIQGSEAPWTNGPKDFTVNPDGTVTLTNGFAAQHITQITVPTASGGVNVNVNNLLKGVFTSVFGEIAVAFRTRPEFATYQLIIGQSFKPRFAAYNATQPHQLSTHTWGVAVDVYVVPVGTSRPVYHLGQTLPANNLIVPFFEKYHFLWGGKFRGARDDIHFQFCGVDGKDVSVDEPSTFE